MRQFFEKHIDSKRLKTGLLQALIIGIFLLIWNNFNQISLCVKKTLWPWLTYEIKFPFIPSLILLAFTQYFAYKFLNKIQIKFGKSNKMKISNWTAIPNKSNAQWTDYYEIALNGRLFQEISCKMQSSSSYFRFGFKLLKHSTKEFGAEGGLLDTSENYLIHIGRTIIHIGDTPGEQALQLTSYLNGIIKDSKTVVQVYNNEAVDLKLSIDKNNIAYFFLNNTEQSRINLTSALRDRIILMAWGDGHEYSVDISDIQVSFL